jgi:dihydrofolate reductase
LSLDGVADKPEGWFAGWGDVMQASLGAVIAAQDCVILGRRSYEEWAGFWPGSGIEPFARHSSTGSPSTSPPPRRSAGFVPDLRNQPGAGIGVHASISVAQALLAAGLIDELRLVIAPVIAGTGRRLLDGLPAIRLEPVRSTTTPAGHLLADYRVIR